MFVDQILLKSIKWTWSFNNWLRGFRCLIILKLFINFIYLDTRFEAIKNGHIKIKKHKVDFNFLTNCFFYFLNSFKTIDSWDDFDVELFQIKFASHQLEGIVVCNNASEFYLGLWNTLFGLSYELRYNLWGLFNLFFYNTPSLLMDIGNCNLWVTYTTPTLKKSSWSWWRNSWNSFYNHRFRVVNYFINVI